MKHLCVAGSVLLLLIACHQSTEGTNTASNASTGSSGQTVAGSGSKVDVSVSFSGLVAHVLGTYQKAVVMNAPGHRHRIKITPPPLGAGEVIKKIGGDCPPDACSFFLNHMALQLLDANGQALPGNLTASDKSFLTLVPDLGDLNASAFADANLTPDAMGDITDTSTITWGTFDLHGGDAHTDPMDCRGKFITGQGQGDFRTFGKKTTVKYTLPSGGILRVTDAKKQTYDISLQGPAFSIEVTNFMPGSHKSDFDQYEKLSKLAPKLPLIMNEPSQACDKAIAGIGELNGVPGCEDGRVGAIK